MSEVFFIYIVLLLLLYTYYYYYITLYVAAAATGLSCKISQVRVARAQRFKGSKKKNERV